MALKALVAATFLRVLPTKRKVCHCGLYPKVYFTWLLPLQGKYYMLLEYTSQMYRSLIPAPLWFRYLSNYYQTGRLFAVFITAIYLMIKVGGAVVSINIGQDCWYVQFLIFLKWFLCTTIVFTIPVGFTGVWSDEAAVQSIHCFLHWPCEYITVFCFNQSLLQLLPLHRTMAVTPAGRRYYRLMGSVLFVRRRWTIQ